MTDKETITEMERLITGALQAQAEATPHPAATPAASDVVHLGDYLGRPAPRRHGHRGGRVALAASAAVAAAAVAALAVGLLSRTGPGGGNGHGSVSAGTSAAAANASSPYGLRPGQYLEVKNSLGGPVFIPADPYGTWVRTGKIITTGTYGRVTTQTRATAKCAAFLDVNPFLAPPKVPGCTAAYGWEAPYRPPFADSLPSDPAAIRASLLAGAKKSGYTPWQLVTTFLDTGYVPNPIALRVIDAVRGLPGVTVTHHVLNGTVAFGGGQYGDAISFRPPFGTGDYVESIIFNPATGQVIGTASQNSERNYEAVPIIYTVTNKAG